MNRENRSLLGKTKLNTKIGLKKNETNHFL